MGTMLASGSDVVSFLKSQHNEIKALFDRVSEARGEARADAFYSRPWQTSSRGRSRRWSTAFGTLSSRRADGSEGLIRGATRFAARINGPEPSKSKSLITSTRSSTAPRLSAMSCSKGCATASALAV